MTPRKSHPSAKHGIKTANETKLPFAPTIPAPDMSERDAPPRPASKATLADVNSYYAAPKKASRANAIDDPEANLQTFTLADLAQFTKEKTYSNDASKDVHLFFIGRDNVHDLLKYVLSRVSISLYLNMFGFDDNELNNIIMRQALDPTITMLITLDKSQAGGVHEKALIEADEKYNLAAFNTHFVIGQSATHQISHTKGFVADGKVACEGSTNWSASGEGHLRRYRTTRRHRLQSAEQYSIRNHRSGHHHPLPDRVDYGAHDRPVRRERETIGGLTPAQNIPVTKAPGNSKPGENGTHKAP